MRHMFNDNKHHDKLETVHQTYAHHTGKKLTVNNKSKKKDFALSLHKGYVVRSKIVQSLGSASRRYRLQICACPVAR